MCACVTEPGQGALAAAPAQFLGPPNLQAGFGVLLGWPRLETVAEKERLWLRGTGQRRKLVVLVPASP